MFRYPQVTGISSCDPHPSRTYSLVTPQLSSRRASGFVQTAYPDKFACGRLGDLSFVESGWRFQRDISIE
jgi:hypothetical protein